MSDTPKFVLLKLRNGSDYKLKKEPPYFVLEYTGTGDLQIPDDAEHTINTGCRVHLEFVGKTNNFPKPIHFSHLVQVFGINLPAGVTMSVQLTQPDGKTDLVLVFHNTTESAQTFTSKEIAKGYVFPIFPVDDD